MQRRVQVAVVALVAVLVGGLGVVGVRRVRLAATRMKCGSNLQSFGLALHACQDYLGHFPRGTVPNAGLPPEKRLSWLVDVWPVWFESAPKHQFDRARAWDAKENTTPSLVYPEEGEGGPDWKYERVVTGDVRHFLCPANPARNAPPLPCMMHYVGVAGVGTDAAALPLSDRRAGLFGHDRKVSLADVKDGQSTTMAMAEVLDGGPWTAGGRATVRGLEGTEVPYLGEGGQFASHHGVVNVLLVDGSVRGLTASLSPAVLEALATIAGGEEVGAVER